MSLVESSELILQIEAQKSSENPDQYDDLHKLKIKHKEKEDSAKKLTKKTRSKRVENSNTTKSYEIIKPHSHLLLLLSVLLTCLFYAVLMKIDQNFRLKKYSHSLCLGIVCLLDFMINKEQFLNFTIKEKSDIPVTSLKDSLIKKEGTTEEMTTISNKSASKYLTETTFLVYTIIMGILCFTNEMLTLYLLDITIRKYHLNISIGFALLSFEAIMIRMHYSFNNIKIEFINFLGLLWIFIIFLFISLFYLSIPLAGVAFFIATLRAAKFFVQMQISFFKMINMNKVMLWINSIDFIIGFILTFVYLVFENVETSLINFSNFFLLTAASVCYYFNMKYFSDYDRYGISIMSLIYPFLALSDLIINNRRINLIELCIILSISAGVSIGFIGDKLWSDSDDQIELDRLIMHENLHELNHGKRRDSKMDKSDYFCN